jgi:hypothetical protein
VTHVLKAGTAAGVLLALVLTAAAGAATVTVRVEGAAQTLVPATTVTPSSAVVVDKTATGGTTCDGAKGGGALELATGGDWGGTAFSFGQSVEVIKGESHVFGTGAFWSFSVNNAPAAVGLCDYEPVEGDELLLYAACDGAPAPTCFSEDPLDVRGPATAAPGRPVTIAVDEYTAPFGATPTKAPSAGATVSGGGATATTGADGTAALTLTERGPVTLTAAKNGRVRDEIGLCVTDGADGFCGTTAPGTTPPPAAGEVQAACQTSGDDGRCGTRDRRAPEVTITGIREQQRFSRARAPRELTATVADDPSGLQAVKLGLSRSAGGRCWVLSGKRAAFRRARCGHHAVFGVDARPAVSYLLAKRLPRGRYVLDVVAIDKAFNRDALARGRNRVVFTVR